MRLHLETMVRSASSPGGKPQRHMDTRRSWSDDAFSAGLIYKCTDADNEMQAMDSQEQGKKSDVRPKRQRPGNNIRAPLARSRSWLVTSAEPSFWIRQSFPQSSGRCRRRWHTPTHSTVHRTSLPTASRPSTPQLPFREYHTPQS